MYKRQGGNIHYERFAREVLPSLLKQEDFAYKKFDCRRMELAETACVKGSPIRIVEGAYSCHPRFGEYADLKVFADIDAETQRERILRRNGAEMAEIFADRWIPMEEKYFACFEIEKTAHIVMRF